MFVWSIMCDSGGRRLLFWLNLVVFETTLAHLVHNLLDKRTRFCIAHRMKQEHEGGRGDCEDNAEHV